MKIDGVVYELVVATDVERDAMQWECYSVNESERKLLLEVVRFDGKREWAFMSYSPSLPLSLVEFVVAHAKKELGPFFDG